MFKEMLVELLNKCTIFSFLVDNMECECDMKSSLFKRALVKINKIISPILEVLWWIAIQLLFISMTGGLYIVWIVLWKIFKKRRQRRKMNRIRK